MVAAKNGHLDTVILLLQRKSFIDNTDNSRSLCVKLCVGVTIDLRMVLLQVVEVLFT